MPFFGPEHLKSWPRIEFILMIILVKRISKCRIINSEGNPFGQGLNDCATLKNRCKHMEIVFEMVDPNLK